MGTLFNPSQTLASFPDGAHAVLNQPVNVLIHSWTVLRNRIGPLAVVKKTAKSTLVAPSKLKMRICDRHCNILTAASWCMVEAGDWNRTITTLAHVLVQVTSQSFHSGNCI